MASYLPVLLVSVSTNSNDDSAVTTLPRGQVDYLSHEWQEEDVWRSWRNMTRQKNEIANGMRLENASWRTWWKQRNKLKTISPETLNWLKDSDVTWLYGPLHTAVEWTPPPRRSTVTPNDHLDLSQPKHKPILKHRNLSEFLTSDLPQSPVFSPPESDSEHEQDEDEDKDDEEAESAHSGLRPPLPHTKSDTHLTRLSKPNRAFRKESPPRVEPPNSGLKSSHAYSGTNLNGYFQSHINHAPSSKTPSPSGTDSATPTHSGIAGHSKKKSKHITFNTFVEQCIAIDKPKSRSSSKVRSGWDGRTGTKGVNWDVNYQDADEDEIEEVGDERGYDEDVESSDEGDWKRTTDADNEFAICTDSEDSDVDIPSSYPPSNDSDEEDDGIIQMRPPRRPSASAPRSHSKSSTSSNSTSSSASSSGSRKRTYTASRRRNSSSASTLRPSSVKSHSSSSSSSSSSSLGQLSNAPSVTTIAPIAPTMLKVGGGNAWDGFGVNHHIPHRTQWMDSFGDESWSDEGYSHFGDESVELVYVPKVGNDGDDEEETFHHRGAYFSIGDADTDMDLGFGEDYFGRSHPSRAKRQEQQELSNRGEEERIEITPPQSTSTSPPRATVQTAQQPASTAPVDIPAAPPSTRPISPPQAPVVVASSSSSSSLLSPPSRGRSSEPVTGDSPRGRSLTRTASWTSDRERSRSMGGSSTSPMGSLSPDGGCIGAVAGGVYANGRADKDSHKERKRRRREGTHSDSGSSVSPDAGSSLTEGGTPTQSVDAFAITEEPRDPPLTPTPATLPERMLTSRSAPSASAKAAAPVVESRPITGRTSGELPSSKYLHHRRVSSGSSTSEGSTIMGRMVTSAGSYLGLWQ